MKITIWITLLAWDSSYYMEARSAHILVLIHDWGCILECNWYIRDTYLPLDDPDALAQEWSNFMSNKIYEIHKEFKGFYLYSYTNRIAIYGLIPSAKRLFGKRKIVKDPRMIQIERQIDHYSLAIDNYSLAINHYFTGDRSLFTSTHE